MKKKRPGACPGCNSGYARANCGDSGYGALRSVAGPFFRPSCGDWNNNCFPYYTGPCGPCRPCKGCCPDSCGCECHHHDDCHDHDPCHQHDDCHDHDSCHHHDPCRPPRRPCGGTPAAGFTAGTPVELAAGEGVRLKCERGSSRDFTADCDGIRIHHAGSYMVVYTVQAPVNECLRSRFMLTLDGECVPSSVQDVAAPEDGSSGNYTMHALVHARAGSMLRLVSMNPVSICGAMTQNLFTLTLHRI